MTDLVGRNASVAAGDPLPTVLLSFRIPYNQEAKAEEPECRIPHWLTSEGTRRLTLFPLNTPRTLAP